MPDIFSGSIFYNLINRYTNLLRQASKDSLTYNAISKFMQLNFDLKESYLFTIGGRLNNNISLHVKRYVENSYVAKVFKGL